MSKEFGVSINTLLGAPRKLICQCCGMPLEDDRIISHDSDGTLDEVYCQWCWELMHHSIMSRHHGKGDVADVSQRVS